MRSLLVTVLIVSLLFFGCTGIQTQLTGIDAAKAAANSDNSKILFYLTMEDGTTLLNGTIHFTSDTLPRNDIQLQDGYVLINRSDVCTGINGTDELYNELLVTFADSPVGETWDWGASDYCNYPSFDMTVTDSQLAEIRNPDNPDLTNVTSIAKLDRNIVFYIITENKTLLSGNATFISAEGNLTVHLSGYTQVKKSDVCDGNVTKYTNLSVAMDVSPIGETRYWSGLDYCSYISQSFLIGDSDLESLKNPTFDISLFEYDNLTGNPVNATVYCGDKLFGSLTNGHLNMSKVDALNMIPDMGCNFSFVGNISLHNRPYLFNFCGWEINNSDVRDYSRWDSSLGSTIENYFRLEPCNTSMSFVTPNDSMVQFRVKRYLPFNSQGVEKDTDDIFNALSNEFKYNNSESSNILAGSNVAYLLPTEFFSSNSGVCLDWSNAFLSLVLAKHPDAPCYVIDVNFVYGNDSIYLPESHADVFCSFNDGPKIYDQINTFTGSSMWQDAFNALDWKGTNNPQKENFFSNQGVVGIVPDVYYNDKIYVPVNGINDLYSKLGVSS